MDLTRKALDVALANMALGNEQFRAAGATFVRNRAHPLIYDANHITGVEVSSPRDIDRLLARADEKYSHTRHRRFCLDFRTHPAVAARLALEGYVRDDALVMFLEGELRGRLPRPCDIRPAATDEDWAAYGGLRMLDWQEHAARQAMAPAPEVGESLLAVARAKQPPVQNWIAYVDGRAAAYFNSWAGIDGIGQVEDRFTHPEFRHRGLATALIHRCIADCRAKGAGPVVIVSDPADTPKQMYADLGFRPVGLVSNYMKRLETPPA